MLFNWFRMVMREVSGSGEQVFIQKVRVRRTFHPVDAFVVIGWALILTKCALASWAIRRWDIPIADFYVWGPSVIFGALCTWLYLTREEK